MDTLGSAVKKEREEEERIPAAIPNVEHQIPKEFDISSFHGDGRLQLACVLGHMVVKDYAPH